jgi:AcrR family transcriptional regulator
MTPNRHNQSSRQDRSSQSDRPSQDGRSSRPDRADRPARPNSPDGDAVLDAVRDCVLAVGVRRTTMTDVARRAGVSRMTLYRRSPDVRSLVGDLMTREWIAVATGAMPEPRPGTDARTLLVEGLVAGVAAFREHPLFRKIVDVDPELLLPYVLDRRGASQEALLGLLGDALRDGHADGSVRVAPVERQARAVLLVVQSFALSLRTMTDEDDPDLTTAAFLGELRTVLERTLTP